MREKEDPKVEVLAHHRLNKKFEKALATMSSHFPPWKEGLQPGSRYITVDARGMVYGRLIELIDWRTEYGRRIPLLARSRHHTAAEPDGFEEEIFIAQVWGLLTKGQYEKARSLGWPQERGLFLDRVVTEDPRYTILFHPSDYDYSDPED